jgi:hypothetical protein
VIPVKAFLAEECENIRRQLTDALRHDYGHEGSKDFYEECLVRLKHILSLLESTLPSELDKLALLQGDLSELSALISRIERSAYSEFSWPFAEELKELALDLCTESTLMGNAPPAIHILAEGGLSEYAIWAEPNRPKGALRKILTIVFPTTLKHSVLLHPILGHEVGHAIYAIPKHQAAVRNLLVQTILSSGPMKGYDEVDAWLFSNAAPATIQALLRHHGLKAPLCEVELYSSWVEEFLCDFVGLVLFGPSFVASLVSLLLGMVPNGISFGWHHPPVLTRLNAILDASKCMKLDDTSALKGDSKAAADKFWTEANAKRFPDPWADVFTAQQISDLVNGLRNLMATSPRAAYSPPADAEFFETQYQALTKGIPPTVSKVTTNGEVENRLLDFRHTLYTGWLAYAAQAGSLKFHEINRLCDMAILQQRAVKHFGVT